MQKDLFICVEIAIWVVLTFFFESGFLYPMGLDLGGAFLAAQESRFGLALADLWHAVGVDVHLTQSAPKTLSGVAYGIKKNI